MTDTPQHQHQLLATSDTQPDGIALGLAAAWREPQDLRRFKLLLAAATQRGPELYGATLTYLLDLATPHQLDYDPTTDEQRLVTGLILARASGLDQVTEQLLTIVLRADVGARLRYLVAAATLVAGLADRGRLELPAVRFLEVGN